MSKKPKRKVGRPKREWTKAQIELIDEYALVQAKDTTIAEALGIPDVQQFLQILDAEHRV